MIIFIVFVCLLYGFAPWGNKQHEWRAFSVLFRHYLQGREQCLVHRRPSTYLWLEELREVSSCQYVIKFKNYSLKETLEFFQICSLEPGCAGSYLAGYGVDYLDHLQIWRFGGVKHTLHCSLGSSARHLSCRELWASAAMGWLKKDKSGAVGILWPEIVRLLLG